MTKKLLKHSAGLGGTLALLTTAMLRLSHAEEAPPASPREALDNQVVAALEVFERGGRWAGADAAVLGWSCGPQLQALVCLYEATGKRTSLERRFKCAAIMRSKPDKAAARAEDTGHGCLDIGFVLVWAENGIVFTDTDLKRCANTFVQAMWNGSLDKPTLGGWVNTSKPTRQSGSLPRWLLLGKVDPKVRSLGERLIPTEGRLWGNAQLHWLWAKEPGKWRSR